MTNFFNEHEKACCIRQKRPYQLQELNLLIAGQLGAFEKIRYSDYEKAAVPGQSRQLCTWLKSLFCIEAQQKGNSLPEDQTRQIAEEVCSSRVRVKKVNDGVSGISRKCLLSLR